MSPICKPFVQVGPTFKPLKQNQNQQSNKVTNCQGSTHSPGAAHLPAHSFQNTPLDTRRVDVCHPAHHKSHMDSTRRETQSKLAGQYKFTEQSEVQSTGHRKTAVGQGHIWGERCVESLCTLPFGCEPKVILKERKAWSGKMTQWLKHLMLGSPEPT